MASDPTRTVRRGPRGKKRSRELSIGSYRADVKPLGKGGMSTVYRAVGETGECVAIKELLPHLRSDREMARRFRLEYEVVSRLDHPNIVRFIDFLEANGTYNIVMEFVDGVSLHDVLRKARRLGTARTAALGHLLAETLQVVHRAGVLHRDLKPGNVLIAGDGTIKLSDFGIAQEEGTRMTATGVVLGSPTYMAPEQLAGKRDAIDQRTDVYALGVMLYQCVEGLDPYRVKRREDLLAVLHRKSETAPRPLKHCTDEDLAALLLRCVDADPARRPADMAEMSAPLAAIAERGGDGGGRAPAGRALGRALLALARPASTGGDTRRSGAAGPAPGAGGRGGRVAGAGGRSGKVAGAGGRGGRVAGGGGSRADGPGDGGARRRDSRLAILATLALAAALAAAAFLLAGRLGG